jgi:hypothetical protein
MRCCVGFFMGNSLSDSKDLLIPFIVVDSLHKAQPVGALETGHDRGKLTEFDIQTPDKTYCSASASGYS